VLSIVTLTAVPTSVVHAVEPVTFPPLESAAPDGSPAPGTSGEPTIEQRLADAEARIAELEDQNDALTGDIASVTSDRDRLAEALAEFQDLSTPMEADRLLVAELRKDLPPDRAEAEAYLARMQSLALISDPAQLGPPAARVMEAAPVFLDWRDQTFGTPEEANQAYVQSGASGFDMTWKLFRNAILLTVSNRLDSVLSLVDRVGQVDQ
jgi:hypothetical protein